MKGKKKDLNPALSDPSTMFFTIVLPVVAGKDINLLKIIRVCARTRVGVCVFGGRRIGRM